MNTIAMTAGAAGSGTIKTAKRVVSASQRFAELMIAFLFVLTAITSIGGVIVMNSILTAPDYLAQIFPHKGAIAMGAMGWSINNIGIVFIAVFAFPLLRKLDETLAVGYLATRIVEGSIMMFGVAATLMLIPLSGAFIKAGAPDGSWYQAIGDVLMQLKLLGLTELALPLMSLGGMIFTWQLFKFRMVPRVISVIGLVGYCLMLLTGLASWFDLVDAAPGSPLSVLAVPVAVFEIILLPMWLVFKGFRMPAATAA